MDIPTLLTSNNLPTQLQSSAVQQVLDATSARIEVLQLEVAALEEDARRHRAILSPVRRMPLELLGEIFVFANPPTLNELARRDFVNHELVCKQWREAALGTHRLWCGLTITPFNKEIAYNKILAWFKRAGSLKRSLCFEPSEHPCLCDETSECRCQANNPLMAKLLTQGPALDHFTLNLMSLDCFRNFMTLLITNQTQGPLRPWDTLRSLKLVFSPYDHKRAWDEPSDPTHSMFTLLPPVTDFQLYLPPPWAAFTRETDSKDGQVHCTSSFLGRLTSFRIKWDWVGTKLFSILQHCINVQTLTIDFDYSSPLKDERWRPSMVNRFRSPMILPMVTTLSLRRSSIDILDYFRMPALLHLDIELTGDPEDAQDFGPTICIFLERSGIRETIQSLRIYSLTITNGGLFSILTRLTGLRHLTLDRVEYDGMLFQRRSSYMLDTGTRTPLLPSLERLNLLQITHCKNIQAELYYMQARDRCSPCIVSVSYAIEQKPVVEADWHDFRKFYQRGTSAPVHLHVYPGADTIIPEDHRMW
ncbi:hypothetical protein DFP72DRAFT_1138318 [Ephemerocybe angulata]|uniref:F-box domain-containing protein n=1 Tax=Ephemerocybe angulata TaxID=980116 RepID=A0A8H6HRR5_9AGAR|nr:hypothetical protein DFP72DRAFT_1138318 [Tulosesus angulatus]